MFEKEAKERAEEIEANQTLGVYDNDEDFARDEGWNDGYVSGYEEGFQNGAEYGYNKKCEEMQAQIEKMKCCENCAKNGHICVAEEMQGKLCGKNKDKWELRR